MPFLSGINKKDVVGFGQQGTVYLDKGFAYKEMHDSWSDSQANRAENIHSHLNRYDIPTYDYFEVDRENHRYKMTDVSDNKKNLVVTMQDIWKLDYAQSASWFKSAFGRKLVDIAAFLDENRETMKKLINSNTYARLPGLLLVVTPSGKASMLLADYDDGIILDGNPSMSQEKIVDMTQSYCIFLKEVFSKFFPKSNGIINDEIEAIINLYIKEQPVRGSFISQFIGNN